MLWSDELRAGHGEVGPVMAIVIIIVAKRRLFTVKVLDLPFLNKEFCLLIAFILFKARHELE